MSFLDNWFGSKKADEKVSPVVLSKILDAMREGVIIVGEDTRILSSNQAAYDAFGRRNGALDGKRLSEVVRDLTLHEAFRKALFDNLSSDIELEIPGIEKRRYDAHVAPIEIAATKGAIGVFYDITQIERLELVRQEFFIEHLARASDASDFDSRFCRNSGRRRDSGRRQQSAFFRRYPQKRAANASPD